MVADGVGDGGERVVGFTKQACGLVGADPARELGTGVPGDLAVVGFDDGDIAASLGLTSVHQPLEESGEIATQVLLAQLESPTRSAQVTSLSLTLVERETS